MPSISEPVTPQHYEKPAVGKWAAASSCEEIDRSTPTGSDYEFPDSPIKVAKSKALKVKRETIGTFLRDRAQEDLSLYIDELRHFACSAGGLVDDEYRAIVWPVLASHLLPPDEDQDDAVSCDSDFESAVSELSESPGYLEDEESVDIEELKQHSEWKQVELDVNRTLARFPPNISENHRILLQDELIPLIVRVLRTNPRFRYYQGFHDVCLTMVLVCGVEKAFRICCQLAHCGTFNSYLLKSLEQSVMKELDLMYIILSRVEPQLEKVMRGVQLGSMFALSWPLTWFSHSLHHYQQIVRFYDVFLASSPLLPVYVSAAVVIFRKPAILTCEREMPFIHHLLSVMPHELPLDALLSDACYLAKLMPPCLLKGRYAIEYKKQVSTPPRAKLPSTIPRYALQLVFVAGAASAAGFYFLTKYSLP